MRCKFSATLIHILLLWCSFWVNNCDQNTPPPLNSSNESFFCATHTNCDAVLLCFQNLLFYYESDTCNRPSGVLLMEGCYCERLITAGCAAKNKDGTDNKQVGLRKSLSRSCLNNKRLPCFDFARCSELRCARGKKHKCQMSLPRTFVHIYMCYYPPPGATR